MNRCSSCNIEYELYQLRIQCNNCDESLTLNGFVCFDCRVDHDYSCIYCGSEIDSSQITRINAYSHIEWNIYNDRDLFSSDNSEDSSSNSEDSSDDLVSFADLTPESFINDFIPASIVNNTQTLSSERIHNNVQSSEYDDLPDLIPLSSHSWEYQQAEINDTQTLSSERIHNNVQPSEYDDLPDLIPLSNHSWEYQLAEINNTRSPIYIRIGTGINGYNGASNPSSNNERIVVPNISHEIVPKSDSNNNSRSMEMNKNMINNLNIQYIGNTMTAPQNRLPQSITIPTFTNRNTSVPNVRTNSVPNMPPIPSFSQSNLPPVSNTTLPIPTLPPVSNIRSTLPPVSDIRSASNLPVVANARTIPNVPLIPNIETVLQSNTIPNIEDVLETRNRQSTLPKIPVIVKVPNVPLTDRPVEVPGRIPAIPIIANRVPEPSTSNPVSEQRSNRKMVTNATAPVLSNIEGVILTSNEQNFPVNNPYLRVPLSIIQEIAREREVTLTGSRQEKAEQLYSFDQILPDWILSITTKGRTNFQELSMNKLYIFAVLNNIHIDDINGLNNREMVNYIRVCLILNDTNPSIMKIRSDLIGRLDKKLLDIFGRKMGLTDSQLLFVSTDELKTSVINNALCVNRETINMAAQRYDQLRGHRHSRLIRELYSITGESVWIRVARSPPHPIESIILNLDKYDPATISTQLGMIIPPQYSNNLRGYIESNIVKYSSYLTRGKIEVAPLNILHLVPLEQLIEYFSKFTDTEIFNMIGIYVPYSSRTELVNNIISTITEQQFMYPCCRNIDRSINKVTVTLTDVTDQNTFMVCYGTAFSYYSYEIEELTEAFYTDRDTGLMDFRHPENPNLKFDASAIEGLRSLLSCFPNQGAITELLRRIDAIIIDSREKIEYDNIARRNLKRFNDQTRTMIKDYLEHLFYTGMYMRRWRGKDEEGRNYPFPLTKESTKADALPDAEVSDYLQNGIRMLKDMGKLASSFCMTLKLCEYNEDGSISTGKAELTSEWNAVITGEQCIRMASSKFVGTGYHYLRSLFNHTIPGMNVRLVARIV